MSSACPHGSSGLRRNSQLVIPEFDTVLEEAITILETRPKPQPPSEGDEEQYIIKLDGSRPGEGQYRLKRKRWRFLYDIAGRDVELLWCGLRDEKTYRR